MPPVKGKLIIPIIDDAHLIPIDALRKLRLLLEDLPRPYCTSCKACSPLHSP